MGIAMLDRRLCAVQVSQRWLDDYGVTREATLGRAITKPFRIYRNPGERCIAGAWRERPFPEAKQTTVVRMARSTG